MKSTNKLSLVKILIENIMRTCALRRPIVFLRVRCIILILMIKTISCSIVRFNIPHCICAGGQRGGNFTVLHLPFDSVGPF
jgi:hypothetical protein